MTRRIALLILAATEALALTVVAVVCAALARDEDADAHDCGGTCPAHDDGPDDLTALAEAVGVLSAAHHFALWEVGL